MKRRKGLELERRKWKGIGKMTRIGMKRRKGKKLERRTEIWIGKKDENRD